VKGKSLVAIRSPRLIIVTSVEYVTVAMSIDNDGEGGILALMALLGIKKHQRPAIVAAGLFGAALIYGDGAITPAISVLSAAGSWTITSSAWLRIAARSTRARSPRASILPHRLGSAGARVSRIWHCQNP
jgi:K+ potassium transporter